MQPSPPPVLDLPPLPGLPAQAPEVAAFHAMQPATSHWQAAALALASQLARQLPGVAPAADQGLQPTSAGTVLVALWGPGHVLKLYPPFLADHCAFEQAVLPLLHGRLAVPTPALLARGRAGDWPWTLMTRLPGAAMDAAWPQLAEADRLRLLRQIGALIPQAQACAAPHMALLRQVAPPWREVLARQRAGCLRRQQRTGLPAHLLPQVEAFVAGAVPEGPEALLTGEYTPMNLLITPGPQGMGLSGMFDFGDGLIGPPEADLLGPLAFLAAGQPARVQALLQGLALGAQAQPGEPAVPAPNAAQRRRWLRLLLLHRYSHLPAQLALAGWQQAPDLETLADWLWAPEGPPAGLA